MSNTEQQTNAAQVVPAGGSQVKSASVAPVDSKDWKSPVYYGGITEDGNFVLMYEVHFDDKGGVKGKSWKSKASLNWRNFLRMMITDVPVDQRTGHLERYRDMAPLIPINTLNGEWISYSHDEILQSDKVQNAAESIRQKVEEAYEYAKKIFSGEIEEKSTTRKRKVEVDPNADPLTYENKATLFKVISDGAPEGYELPNLARTKKEELLELAIAARDGKLQAETSPAPAED